MRILDFKRSVSQFEIYLQNQLSDLPYAVSAHAPNDLGGIDHTINQGQLIVWDGASDNTIFSRPEINHIYRAHHDYAHAAYRLDTVALDEMQLSKILESQAPTREIQALIRAELAGQVEYYMQHGAFPKNQKNFCVDYLIKKGWTVYNV